LRAIYRPSTMGGFSMYWCWRLLPSVVLLVALLLGVSDASAKRPVQRPPCGARLADHTAFVEAAGRYAGKFPRPPVPRSFADTAKRSKRFEDDFLRKLPALAPKSPQIARFECLSTFGARVAFATSDRRVRRATKRLETALAPPRTLSQIEIALRQAARDPVIVGVPGGRFGIRVARNLASGGRAVYEPDFLLTSTRTALRSRGVILTRRRVQGHRQRGLRGNRLRRLTDHNVALDRSTRVRPRLRLRRHCPPGWAWTADSA
jgi:hypothetical protein